MDEDQASVLLRQAVRTLRRLGVSRPELGLVLGSGFGAVAQAVQAEASVPWATIPGFVPSTVPGHDGRLVAGRLGGLRVVLFCGRAHYYEGHGLAQVTFPIRVLAALGVSSILLTNAAGAINPRFRPGDFMMLTDHLNLSGLNPLRGLGVVGSGQFVDLSELYDPGLCRILKRAAKLAHTPLRAGVYAWMPGPSYETPAEVRALAKLGADAVGMSTVHEAIVARQCGLRTVAVSCLTNQAAGRSPRALCHREVLLAAVRASARAVRLLEQFARLYGKEFAGARRRA